MEVCVLNNIYELLTCHHFFSKNINYNEKGQRSDIFYGNGSKTHYHYDKNTFRLIRLLTNRNDNNNDENVLQDIHYTYDPVGNIVEIVDNAQQNHYFSNSVIEPRAMYKYDALYRLTEATGRELASLQLPTHSDFANNIPVPNMGNNAMQNYTQQFTYDELGNILQMKSAGRWTRDYHYDILHNNYLIGHAPRAVDYTYDEHGNMLSMPHLQSMGWDYKDQLSSASNGTFTSYYVYDAGGQRVRKVVEKGNVIEERIYVGSYERFINSTLTD